MSLRTKFRTAFKWNLKLTGNTVRVTENGVNYINKTLNKLTFISLFTIYVVYDLLV